MSVAKGKHMFTHFRLAYKLRTDQPRGLVVRVSDY